MAVLGRDDILGADDLETRRVECPKWGGTVRLQEMTAAIYEEFEEHVVTMNTDNPEVNKGNLRGWLVFFSVVDDDGNRVFSDVADVKKLAEKSATEMLKVCAEIQEMNGIGEKEVEELVEDFGESPRADSATA